ncbi:type II toxin-antitoxin system HicA family toxin [Paenibacillus apiarius]|uniref:type II toxin-antitoxin system HicA family toxin n=1 Tax=Paenibacillus apiarius TaxID=46240 RepID=UPI003B3B4B66
MRVKIEREGREKHLGKQRTVREVLQALKAAGFYKSPTHGKGTSHRRYIHKEDPTPYADVSYHSSGDVLAKGTLRSIERTSGVEF